MCHFDTTQWKPLNMIALGQFQTDHIYQLITRVKCLNRDFKSDSGLDQFDHIISDHIKQYHCTYWMCFCRILYVFERNVQL
jgi:hypothetical protein